MFDGCTSIELMRWRKVFWQAAANQHLNRDGICSTLEFETRESTNVDLYDEVFQIFEELIEPTLEQKQLFNWNSVYFMGPLESALQDVYLIAEAETARIMACLFIVEIINDEIEKQRNKRIEGKLFTRKLISQEESLCGEHGAGSFERIGFGL